jgi:acetate---CoA ligase (ADP-forming)
MADFIDVSGLLFPKSVAVIGATNRTGDPGGDALQHVIQSGFPGRVWSVNANAARVQGAESARSVAALPHAPDLAILSLPADAIAQAIRDCAARGTRYGVAFAGDGAALCDEVAAACRETGFTLCGPNSIGIVNVATRLSATFASVPVEFAALRTGPISIVTQSGGIGITICSMVQRAGFGFRHLIGSGDEAVVRFSDYLYALARDDGTRIIAAYLERVGDDARLVRALEEARDRGKTVVMIKAGAGEDRVFEAIRQELGVIRARSVEELLDTCLLLAGSSERKPPRGRRIGIVTVGEGDGMLARDLCIAHGLSVRAFRAESSARLPEAMDALAARPDIDSLLFIVGPLDARTADLADTIIGFCRRCRKPVCVSWPSPPPGAVARLATAGIVVFAEPDRALRALERLVEHNEALARPPRGDVGAVPFDWDTHVEPGTTVVTEDRCHAILIDAGLPVAPGRLAIDAAAALPIAHQIGLPVALKGISPRLTDCAAAGLLAIDLRSTEDVLAGFRRLEDRARAKDITLDGIYVQKMLRDGVELRVSVFRDPIFGSMVSCGSGGVLGELIDDVLTARAPVTEAYATDMIERLRCRGAARDAQGLFDAMAPAAFVARLSQLGASAPWRRFTFDVNPVRWTRGGVVAAGGLLVIGQ